MDLASLPERFQGQRILWQTLLGGYCLGLEGLVPIAVVATLDDGLDLDVIECKTGIRFFSYARRVGRREPPDDKGIDRAIDSVRQDVEAALAEAPRESWTAVCPYASRALSAFTAEAGIRCVSVDWDLFQWFSSKVHLLEGLAKLGLPVLAGRWLRLSSASYQELAANYGGRFVAQAEVGVSGSGTAFVESDKQYEEATARFGHTPVRVTRHVGALSFNVNAIATGRCTAVGYPSVQIVGQPLLESKPGGHCGNDFSATASVERRLVNSVREQTSRIGDWMADRGYRGLFGLDFVVCDATGEVCAVDLNPRWQGSTSLETQAERRQGRVPLAAVEIAYRLGLVDDREVMEMSDSFYEPLEGSQVFPRNRAPGDWTATRAMEVGALGLDEIDSPNGIAVSSGIPRPGMALAAGTRLLRICGLRQAVDARTGRMLPWVEEAARRVYDEIALEPVR